MKKDYYQILGVSKESSIEEIKKSYRRLAKKYHPDLNAGNRQAEEKFKNISEAYHVLSDPQRRADYDRSGSTPFGSDFDWNSFTGNFRGGRINLDDLFSGHGSGGFGTIDDIFYQAFGGGAKRAYSAGYQQPRRGADIEYLLRINFLEAIKGTNKRININTAGKEETIEVKVPAGVDSGSRLRLSGKGEAGAAGRGDLFIRLEVLPHRQLKRDGLDLHLDLPVSLEEAAFGRKIKLNLPSAAINLTIPRGSQSGNILRLKGKGIKKLSSKEEGDLYLKLQLKLPAKLSPEQQENIKQFSKLCADFNPRAELDLN